MTTVFYRFLAAMAAIWALAIPPASASTFTTVYSVTGTGDGAGPQGGFVAIATTLYGMTTSGGTTGNGTIVKLDTATGAETVLYNFAGGTDGSFPNGNLLNVAGIFYGTTQYGGAHGIGTIFKFDPATGTETVIWSFAGPEGSEPGSTLIDVGGTLFGTAQYGGANGTGTVFKFVPATGAASAVYSFAASGDANNPVAGLIDAAGTLYGTAPGGGATGNGAIFSIDPASGKEALVYSFAGGTDGAYPYAGLNYAGGVLHGTTEFGGKSGLGTIFAFDLASGKESIRHSFAGAADGALPLAGLIAEGSLLYGVTDDSGPGGTGTLFAFNLSTGSLTLLHSFEGIDGGFPQSPPFLLNGTFYGTTAYGGSTGQGTIFSLPIAGGTEKLLHNFTGSTPVENVGPTVFNNLLYVQTSDGGTAGAGSEIQITPATGSAKILHDFSPAGGLYLPIGNLLPALSLYGVTDYGGNPGCGGYGCGGIFKINPKTGAQSTVYAFASGGEFASVGDLINVSGVFYGTNYSGDANGQGAVFTVNPTTGTSTVLYSFKGGADGAYPFAPVLNVGGTLYGTTTQGGTNGVGTIFKINLATGAESVIHTFGGSGDGAFPYSGLIDVGGLLYGTTFSGGTNNWGTVYRFNPATGAQTVLHSFQANGVDGTQPGGNLLYLNGLLYGMTVYGGHSGSGCSYNVCGTLFSVNPTTGAETILHAFAGGAEGGNPPYAPLVTIGGVLYGTTGSAGAHGLGTIFSFTP